MRKKNVGKGAAVRAQKRRWRVAFAPITCALSLCAFGCSMGTTESDKAPSEQCRDFEDAYCAKAVECAASTDRADFGDTCAFSFKVYLPCAKVTVVAAETQPCLDALDAISCSDVKAHSYPATPSACQRLYGSDGSE